MFGQLKFAARMLVKTRGFTTVTVLALVLGLGASATVFSASSIPPHAPLGFVIVRWLLALVGLLACGRPARPALQPEPVEARRYE